MVYHRRGGATRSRIPLGVKLKRTLLNKLITKVFADEGRILLFL
jgi:hypothetical protein